MANESNPNQQTQSSHRPEDPAAILLDILRRIDKEVTVPVLTQDAKDAIAYHDTVASQLASGSLSLDRHFFQFVDRVFVDLGTPVDQGTPG
jgi:hypothetical protein